mmetsp:Transcript_22538/g.70861  ORF Transcript_22538/g.70861 Transcript_22538/m.70861 type:complete len:234 (+) Transcript_22538:253-954(+)
MHSSAKAVASAKFAKTITLGEPAGRAPAQSVARSSCGVSSATTTVQTGQLRAGCCSSAWRQGLASRHPIRSAKGGGGPRRRSQASNFAAVLKQTRAIPTSAAARANAWRLASHCNPLWHRSWHHTSRHLRMRAFSQLHAWVQLPRPRRAAAARPGSAAPREPARPSRAPPASSSPPPSQHHTAGDCSRPLPPRPWQAPRRNLPATRRACGVRDLPEGYGRDAAIASSSLSAAP